MNNLPMTLGNMRANGVHTLAVWCDALGHHHRVLDVTAYADDVPVPAFGSRMVCGAVECPLLDQSGQKSILASGCLSAFDLKRTQKETAA